MPTTGRDDQIVQRALARVLAHVFGHGGEAAVLRTLKADGKTPGDAADLWTMCRLLKIVGELTPHNLAKMTLVLYHKQTPSSVKTVGVCKNHHRAWLAAGR